MTVKRGCSEVYQDISEILLIIKRIRNINSILLELSQKSFYVV